LIKASVRDSCVSNQVRIVINTMPPLVGAWYRFCGSHSTQLSLSLLLLLLAYRQRVLNRTRHLTRRSFGRLRCGGCSGLLSSGLCFALFGLLLLEHLLVQCRVGHEASQSIGRLLLLTWQSDAVEFVIAVALHQALDHVGVADCMEEGWLLVIRRQSHDHLGSNAKALHCRLFTKPVQYTASTQGISRMQR
jgi:hypothetical protein